MKKVTKTFNLVNVGIQLDFNVLIVNPLIINTETLKESIKKRHISQGHKPAAILHVN